MISIRLIIRDQHSGDRNRIRNRGSIVIGMYADSFVHDHDYDNDKDHD